MARVIGFFRRGSSEDGSQLVEFALVLPMLLLVVLGIAEFGIIFQRYEVVTNAAREGARMAVLPGGYTDADVQARVRTYLTNGRVANTVANTVILVDDVQVPVGGGRPPLSAKRVTVTYTHSYLFLGGIGAWFGSTYTTVPLQAVAEMRDEVAGS